MKKRKARVKFTTEDPPMTPFKRAGFTAKDVIRLSSAGELPDVIYLNNIYQVLVRFLQSGQRGYPEYKNVDYITHLRIKRIDDKPIRNWKHLQQIKNEVLGRDVEACELFPAEARYNYETDYYHLWALPEGKCFPWGFFDDSNREKTVNEFQAITEEEVEGWSEERIEKMRSEED